MSKGKRFIFVGGAPRSGTTLTQKILDSHPDIFAGPEFDHIPYILNLRNSLHSGIDNGNLGVFSQKGEINKSIRKLIENLLLPAADKNHCRFISEKTPLNVLYFKELMEIFPQAKCIHVIRDPRAVINSMFQVGKRAENKGFEEIPLFFRDINTSLELILSCLVKGFEAAKLFKGRVYNLYYEKLVIEPEKEIKKLCDFLEIEWDAKMLNLNDRKHPDNYIIDDIWFTSNIYYRNPDVTNLFAWQTNLSSDQIIKITKTLKNNKELRSLGYDFEAQYDLKALLSEAGSNALEKTDFEKAEKLFLNLCIIDKTPQNYYQLGISQFNLEKYKLALESLTKSLGSDFLYQEKAQFLIKCLEKLGDYKTAETFLKRLKS
jgi:protein-tyrosine sulfotransferase